MKGEKLEVTRASGNVLRDLEHENADIEQFQAILAAEIVKTCSTPMGIAEAPMLL